MIVRQTVEGLEISWRDGTTRIVPLLTADEVFHYLPEYEAYEAELKAGLTKRATANRLPLMVVYDAMKRKYPDLNPVELWKNLDHDTLHAVWSSLWCCVFLAGVEAVGPVQ
jgi:hypothetical protein